MTIKLKTPDEIEKMRVAGQMASEVLDLIEPHVVPGVTTDELNTICHEHIVNVQKGIPATLGYKGFTKSICTSINQQICHGIPSDRKLKKNDIVNIDVTVIKDGYFGDTSRMYYVGPPQPHAQKLCECAYDALVAGIEVVKPGATLGDVGHAIQVAALWATRCGRCSGSGYDVYDRANGESRQASRSRARRRLDGCDQRSQLIGAMGAHGSGHRHRL